MATSGPLGASVTSSGTINDINTSRVEILGEDNYDCCDAKGQSFATPTARPLTDLSATCTASGTGRSASTTIANGWLYLDSGWSDGDAIYPEAAADAGGVAEHDPVKVALPTNPAPGTTHAGHIHLAADSTDDYTVVFNEQITNPDGSLTVNAVHQHLGTNPPDAFTGDLVIGQATCGVPAGSGALRRAVADFDGNGTSDRSVFRSGAWYAGDPTALGSAAPTRTPRALAPVHAEGHRPLAADQQDLDSFARPQQPPHKTLGFHETIGAAVRASCAHRLNPLPH